MNIVVPTPLTLCAWFARIFFYRDGRLAILLTYSRYRGTFDRITAACSGPADSHLCCDSVVEVAGRPAQRINFFIFHALSGNSAALIVLFCQLSSSQQMALMRAVPGVIPVQPPEPFAPWSCIDTTLLTKQL